MTLILGIDPGLHGAFAFYDPSNPQGAVVQDFPILNGSIDGETLFQSLQGFPPSKAIIEKVGSLPRQGGAFNFGLYTGIVHGVLGACAIPFEQVTPVVWKRAMGLTRTHPEETQAELKDRSRALATQLFPHLANELSRKKDDGRAEALLLAVYYSGRK